MPKRNKQSRQWYQQHINDPYVKAAAAAGWRSRAACKLLQLHEKYSLFKPGMCVLDLGAAPGGWSQVVGKVTNHKAHIIAVDILSMTPLPGVCFIQGDILSDNILEEIIATVMTMQKYPTGAGYDYNSGVDMVISDMAPNLSGIRVADQAKAMYLAEIAYDTVSRLLLPKGHFVTKLFHGEGFDVFVKKVRQDFAKVNVVKPQASRAHSKETYLVARDYRALNR